LESFCWQHIESTGGKSLFFGYLLFVAKLFSVARWEQNAGSMASPFQLTRVRGEKEKIFECKDTNKK
jgi:hypothetical protein